MLAVTLTLALVGLSVLIAAGAARRALDATATIARLRPGDWELRAAELRQGAQVLRDAVERRGPR